MADLQVVITGKDGVSRVFQQVGKSAQEAGRDVEQAGRKGEQSFKRLDDSARRAGASFDDFSVALTALGAGLAYAGNAALDQEQTIIGLRAAYGQAADEMLRFADEMASATIFNDDDILKGERYFATLRNNYDLTTQDVQQLMQVTADLASAYGTTFEDASSRITAAIRGEGEAAEFLGLTMNQQAIDRDNLTLSMSNQEAAQFRLNALYQQTGVYSGVAQQVAESEVGTRARLTNAIQDNAQALGEFIGPMGSMVAGMGFAVAGLANLTGSLGRMVNTVRDSQRAMSLLGMATNPVALGLSALAVAGIATWVSFQQGREAAKRLEDALISVGDVATNLRLGHRDQEADWVDQFKRDFAEVVAGSEAFINDEKRVFERAGQFMLPDENITDAIDRLKEEFRLTGDEATDYANAQVTVASAFADSRVNHEALATALQNLRDEFNAGNITLDQYAIGVGVIADNIAAFRDEVDDTTQAMQANEAAASALSIAYEGLSRVQTHAEEAGRRVARSLDDQARSALDAVKDMDALAHAFGEMGSADKLDALPPKLEGLKDASREAFGQLVEDVRAANEAFATAFLNVTGDADFASQLNLTGLATDASILAENLADVTASLENMQRVVIGNTDAIGQQLSGLNDWATNLIGDPGTWAEIDDLLNEGRISVEKYTAAQQAQIEIGAANAQVQRDVLAIQAAQAPILAGAAQTTAEYVQQIRELNDGYNDAADGAQQQLAALGWMDSAMQGQVQQVLEMATMLGDLGPAGAAAFDSMIAGIVATDPVMTAMLENLQLIDNVVRDQDGKVISYDVNLDGVEGAMSDIDQLKLSINALIETLGGEVPPLSLDVEGTEDVEAANVALSDLTANLPDDIDIAVAADTSQAESEIAAVGSQVPPITVPVELDLGGLGQGAGGTAASAARAALGQAGNAVQIEVSATDSATPVLETVQSLASEIDGYSASVEITATDSASPVVGTAITLLSSVDGYTSTLNVAATDNASAVIGNAVTFASSVDGYTTTLLAEGVDNASAVIGGAVSFLASVDGYSSTVYLNAVDNASPAIGNAISLLSSIDGYTATTYINTVTTSTKAPGSRHGGIPGFAGGGIPAELAEAGGEVLRFSNGGSLPIVDRGIYAVPPGTYVSPHNANEGVRGGLSIGPLYITVEGSVTSENNLALAVADKIAPAIADAVSQRRAGMGA